MKRAKIEIILLFTLILMADSCVNKPAKNTSTGNNSIIIDKDTVLTANNAIKLTTDKKMNNYRVQYIDKPVGTAQIDREFEKLDIDAFNLKKKIGEYRNQFDSGIEIHIQEGDYNIIYEEILSDSYFTIYKVFDLNGFLKHKGLTITHSNCSVGVWYSFNESGEIVEEVDWDKPYKLTFDDVLKFCKKENIIVKKGSAIPDGYYLPATFFRDSADGKSWWSIEHFIPEGILRETIVLEGNTGKVISRKSVPIIW